MNYKDQLKMTREQVRQNYIDRLNIFLKKETKDWISLKELADREVAHGQSFFVYINRIEFTKAIPSDVGASKLILETDYFKELQSQANELGLNLIVKEDMIYLSVFVKVIE